MKIDSLEEIDGVVTVTATAKTLEIGNIDRHRTAA